MAASASSEIARKPMSSTARLVLGTIARGPKMKNPTSAFKSVFNRLMPPYMRHLASEVADRADLIVARHGVWRRALSNFFSIPRQILSVITSALLSPFFNKERSDLHLLLRKRFVYDEVVAAIAAGAEQVLIMGAGFDVLCLVLAKEHPDVLFVEVDQPTTQVVKREIIEDVYSIDGPTPSNHIFVGVDFRFQQMDEQLQLSGKWRPDALSVAVAEGLWPYLSPDEIRSSVQQFRRMSKAGSKIVFNYYLANSIAGTKILSFLLSRVYGEPIKFLPESVDEIENLLSEEGYTADLSEDSTDCYKRYIVARRYDRFIANSPHYRNFLGTAITKKL